MSCFWCGQHGTSDCQVRGILGDLAPIKLLILGMAQFIQFMFGFYMVVSENSVFVNPMVLLIIIPIKWLFHWEYTQHFQTKPHGFSMVYHSTGFPSQKILQFPLISWGSFNVRELPVAWSWVPQRRSAACKGRPRRPAARGVPKSLRVGELSMIPHHSHRPSQTYPLVN